VTAPNIEVISLKVNTDKLYFYSKFLTAATITTTTTTTTTNNNNNNNNNNNICMT
jgi:hypothetical protein